MTAAATAATAATSAPAPDETPKGPGWKARGCGYVRGLANPHTACQRVGAVALGLAAMWGLHRVADRVLNRYRLPTRLNNLIRFGAPGGVVFTASQVAAHVLGAKKKAVADGVDAADSPEVARLRSELAGVQAEKAAIQSMAKSYVGALKAELVKAKGNNIDDTLIDQLDAQAKQALLTESTIHRNQRWFGGVWDWFGGLWGGRADSNDNAGGAS